MSIDRNSPRLGPLLALSGLLCTAFGFLAFGQRHLLAATFFGADFFFGVPLTKADSYKVLFMGVQSLGAVGFGLTMLISGVVIAIYHGSRMRNPTEAAGAGEPAPTSR